MEKLHLLGDIKGLQRHLRLCHNVFVSKGFLREKYFEMTDNEAVVDIHSNTKKSYRKEKNSKWGDWKKGADGTKSNKKPFARIIYTPMGNKR